MEIQIYTFNITLKYQFVIILGKFPLIDPRKRQSRSSARKSKYKKENTKLDIFIAKVD